MDANSESTSPAHPPADQQIVHQLVSLVGVCVGALAAFYYSAWTALPIFALAVWVAPSPRVVAGLASLATAGMVGAMAMSYLPIHPNELLALGNTALFAWAAALLRTRTDLSPVATVNGMQQLAHSSPIASLLIDAQQRVVQSTHVCNNLIGGENGPSLVGERLPDLIHCPPLRDYLENPEHAYDFDNRPIKVRSLGNESQLHLAIDARPLNYRNNDYVLLTFSARDPEVRTAQSMREKITELHANVAAVKDLVIAIGGDGFIRSSNSIARDLLPQLQSAASDSLRIGEVVKIIGDTSFKVAFKEASQRPQKCSNLMTLVSRAPNANVTLSGRLHRFPGSKGVTLIASDITEEIELKQQLTRQKSQHQQLLNATPTALFVLQQATGNIIEVNRTTLEQFGYPADALVGDNIFDCGLLANDFESKLLRQHLDNGKELVEGEFTLTTKSAQTMRAEYTLRRGELAGQQAYFMHVRDITRKHLSEIALRESEEKFSRIFTESPDGIAIVDLESLDILDANKQFIERSNFPQEEIIGAQFQNFLASPEVLEAAIAQVVQRGHPPRSHRYRRLSSTVSHHCCSLSKTFSNSARQNPSCVVVSNGSEAPLRTLRWV